MGKESKKEWISVYMETDSLCCTHETNTTLYINHTPIKIKKKMSLLIFTKCLGGILIGIILNPQISLGRTDIVTILSLPIQE